MTSLIVKLRTLCLMAVPYVEAVIAQLEDEVDREYSHTEAQKSIQKQITDAEAFITQLKETTHGS